MSRILLLFPCLLGILMGPILMGLLGACLLHPASHTTVPLQEVAAVTPSPEAKALAQEVRPGLPSSSA